MIKLLHCCLTACIVFIAAASAAAAPLPIKVIANIPLPGEPSRFDYESIDSRRHVLYVAHLGAGTVIAFDMEHRKVIAQISNVARVHGVLAIPSLGLVYASATGTNEVVAISEATNTIVARMPGGVYPDGMAYDPNTKRLFVSDEHGDTETVIDVVKNHVLATIPLGGDVGNTQYDAVSKDIFIDVQIRNELVVIDATGLKIISRYPLPGCANDHSLLIDAVARLAYIACDRNAKLITFDIASKRVIDAQDIGQDPDVLAFDPTVKMLYVSAESGVVSIFDTGSKPIVKLGEALFAPYAHVLAVDPSTHEVYFPLQNIGGHPVMRIVTPTELSRTNGNP